MQSAREPDAYGGIYQYTPLLVARHVSSPYWRLQGRGFKAQGALREWQIYV